MKSTANYLPPSLRSYVGRPRLIVGAWLIVALAGAIVVHVTGLDQPMAKTSVTSSEPSPTTESAPATSPAAASAEPTVAAQIEITAQDEAGKYKISENGTDLGRIKLQQANGVSVLKFYDASDALKLKVKLKSDSVNFYSADGKRGAKLKYKKGRFNLRREGSVDIREDLDPSSLSDAIYLYLPVSADVRRKLVQSSSTFTWGQPDEADLSESEDH